MSTDSHATSSASESQEPKIGGEMMVVEGSFKYKSWLSSVFEEAKLLFSFALPTPTQLFSNTVDDRVDE